MAELETQLIIAKEINYLNDSDLAPLLIILDDLRKMAKSLNSSLSHISDNGKRKTENKIRSK
jgi:hypothetical protein